MQYKAIIFDVDGTAVPLAANEASVRLQTAIASAQKTISLSAATGRSYEYAKPVFTSLGLISPSVLLGGSAIIDPRTDKIIWNKSMSIEQTDEILKQVSRYQADTFLGVSPVKAAIPLSEYAQQEHSTSIVYALTMSAEQAPELVSDISAIPHVIAHPTPSWTRGMVDVHITHDEATKEHGIQALIEMLGLKSSEVIGVGDSTNDLPIFKATGRRIAMGNAQSVLKEQADEIAPSVDDDGLAQIIEKYFL
jgi:HAD superfamily hydrolase (TIGR01484 family)